MTKADHMIHIRVDKDNLKTALRRAKEDYRENMTAYINSLIKADASKGGKKK